MSAQAGIDIGDVTVNNTVSDPVPVSAASLPLPTGAATETTLAAVNTKTMPTDLFTRIDLDCIYPPLLEKILDLVAKCRKAGKDYYAVSGYRSYEEQAKKYAIGREGGGNSGKRITNAKPGYSLHQYGLAIDFALDDDPSAKGLQTKWSTSHGEYDLLRDSAVGTGLQVGVPTVAGGDKGHVQIHIPTVFKRQEMSILQSCRGVYLKQRALKDVWAWLDSQARWPK